MIQENVVDETVVVETGDDDVITAGGNASLTPAAALAAWQKVLEDRHFILFRILMISGMPIVLVVVGLLLVLAFGHALCMVALILAMSGLLIFCIPPVLRDCAEKLNALLHCPLSKPVGAVTISDESEPQVIILKYISFAGLLIGAFFLLDPVFAISLSAIVFVNLLLRVQLSEQFWNFFLKTPNNDSSSVEPEDINMVLRKLLIGYSLMVCCHIGLGSAVWAIGSLLSINIALPIAIVMVALAFPPYLFY